MSTTLMDIYIKSVCEGMDICVTCSSVCPELELELLAEDTITVLRGLLHDFDLDSCLKLLRPNKKLSLCKTCNKTLKNASLFRNKALKSLRELEKEWCRNELQQNTHSTSAVENTLTNETIDIKLEVDLYPASELNTPEPMQSPVLSHITSESNDLQIQVTNQINNEYDSDDYALSEFHSVSSENIIVPKEEIIETDPLACEENIGYNYDRTSLKAPIFEASHCTQASKSRQKLKSKPVKKVRVKEVKKNKPTRIKKPVQIIEKSLLAKDQTVIISETESECELDQGETDGGPIRGHPRIRARDTDSVEKRINQVINMNSTSTSHSNSNSAPKRNFCTCFVPMCPSNSTIFPNKIFLSGPNQPELRKRWFQAARREYDDLAIKTKYRCCEDHFDLENDVENWVKYKLVGGKLFLKKNVVPHFFECQNRMKPLKPRPLILKRKRQEIIENADVTIECIPDTEIPEDIGNLSTQTIKTSSSRSKHTTADCGFVT